MIITPHERQVGRRLRDLLLSRARERMAHPDFNSQPVVKSGLMAAMAPYVRVDNMNFIHIYQAPLGGWHADLHFLKTPPGVMNTIGSPVTEPCKTREDALTYAEGLVEFVIALENQAPAKADPVFMFHGFKIELDAELLDQLASVGARYENQTHAVRRIEEIQAAMFPDGIPEAELELSDHVLAEVLAVLHMAAMTGVMRYPALEPAIINDAESS